MWRLILSCCVIVWAASSFAGECTTTFGDWKLKKGDIASIEVTPSSSKPKYFDVSYSFADKDIFPELSKRYLDKALPVHIGAYSVSPIVRSIMYSNAAMIGDVTKKEADEISKELGYCI